MSIWVPIIFPAVKYNDQYYVDAGVKNLIPLFDYSKKTILITTKKIYDYIMIDDDVHWLSQNTLQYISWLIHWFNANFNQNKQIFTSPNCIIYKTWINLSMFKFMCGYYSKKHIIDCLSNEIILLSKLPSVNQL